jgi:hypothetical protein
MHNCETCVKSFSCERALNRHLASKGHLLRESKEKKTYSCHCGKTFFQCAGLSRHKKKCSVPKPSLQAESLEEQMKKMREDFEREKEEMKAQISLLLDKQAGIHNSNNTNNTNNTNIDTQNNTINIHINAFGNENTDYLDDKAILQCIDRVYKSIPAIIEKLHFNPQHPENHNIKITNKKLPYASVMGNNQRWKTVDRKDAIDKMVTNGYYMLDEKYETNKDKFDPRKQKNFETFKNSFETEEKNTMKMVKGDVEMLVINGPSV